MREILTVGIGGFIGSVGRYRLATLILQRWPVEAFPLPTLLVNILGCFVAGLLTGSLEHYPALSPNTRLFLFTGILGGFTTFSAFGLETMHLLRGGQSLLAIVNVISSVIVGCTAVLFGIKLGEQLFSS